MTKTPTLKVKFYEDTETKQTPWAAKVAVKKYNDEHEHLYTPDEKAKGAELLAAAQTVFIRSRCFLNFRENTMVVKVETPKSSDKLTSAFDAFEKAMGELGADRKNLNGHYLYHIFPR